MTNDDQRPDHRGTNFRNNSDDDDGGKMTTRFDVVGRKSVRLSEEKQEFPRRNKRWMMQAFDGGVDRAYTEKGKDSPVSRHAGQFRICLDCAASFNYQGLQSRTGQPRRADADEQEASSKGDGNTHPSYRSSWGSACSSHSFLNDQKHCNCIKLQSIMAIITIPSKEVTVSDANGLAILQE